MSKSKKSATIYDFYRMYKSFIDRLECPFEDIDCHNYGQISKEDVDKINDSILAWVAEHTVKTRQDVFLEQYPEAIIDSNNVLKIRPCLLIKDSEKLCNISACDCNKCRSEFWLEQVE